MSARWIAGKQSTGMILAALAGVVGAWGTTPALGSGQYFYFEPAGSNYAGPGATNDWNNAANWSLPAGPEGGAGVPGSSDHAVVGDDDNYIPPYTNPIVIGDIASGTNASALDLSVQFATLNLAGNLTSGEGENLQLGGSIVQTGGTNDILGSANGVGLAMDNSNGPAYYVTYQLKGGTLNVAGSIQVTDEDGTGTEFVQTGGNWTATSFTLDTFRSTPSSFSSPITLAASGGNTPTMNLIAGELDVSTLTIQAGGTFNQAYGSNLDGYLNASNGVVLKGGTIDGEVLDPHTPTNEQGFFNTGTLNFQSGTMTGSVTNTSTGTINYSGGTFSANLTNNGALVVNSPLKISGSLTNNSTVNVPSFGIFTALHVTGAFDNEGVLNASGQVALDSTGAVNGGKITLSSGGSLSTNGLTNSGTVSVSSGGGGINAGTGTFANNGTLSVGTNTATVTGSTTLGANSAASFQIGGSAASSIFGKLQMLGSAVLGGALDIAFTNNWSSQVSSSDAYTVITASGGLSGSFANTFNFNNASNIYTLDGLHSFALTYGANSVTLSNAATYNTPQTPASTTPVTASLQKVTLNPNQPGQVQATLNSSALGTFSSTYYQAPSINNLSVYDSSIASPVNFVVPDANGAVQLWVLHYTGTLAAGQSAQVTLSFDPTNMTADQISNLYIEHYVGGDWDAIFPIENGIDLANDTITFDTDSFSPFALAVLPEPSSATLLVFGAIGVLSRRRRSGRAARI